jgi:hypothetical protein
VRLTSTKRKRKGAEKLLLSPSSLAGPKFGGANAFYQNKAQYNRSSSRLIQMQQQKALNALTQTQLSQGNLSRASSQAHRKNRPKSSVHSSVRPSSSTLTIPRGAQEQQFFGKRAASNHSQKKGNAEFRPKHPLDTVDANQSAFQVAKFTQADQTAGSQFDLLLRNAN